MKHSLKHESRKQSYDQLVQKFTARGLKQRESFTSLLMSEFQGKNKVLSDKPTRAGVNKDTVT